jgi:hypothetical protein
MFRAGSPILFRRLAPAAGLRKADQGCSVLQARPQSAAETCKGSNQAAETKIRFPGERLLPDDQYFISSALEFIVYLADFNAVFPETFQDGRNERRSPARHVHKRKDPGFP